MSVLRIYSGSMGVTLSLPALQAEWRALCARGAGKLISRLACMQVMLIIDVIVMRFIFHSQPLVKYDISVYGMNIFLTDLFFTNGVGCLSSN